MAIVLSTQPFVITVPTGTVINNGVALIDLTSVGVRVAEDVLWATDSSGDYVDIDTANCALVDTTAGDVELTLPLGTAALAGRRFSLIQTVAANSAGFIPSGANTIEGVGVMAVAEENARLDVMFDGVNTWRRCSPSLVTSNYLKTYNNLVDVANPKLARQAIGANEQLLQGVVSALPGSETVLSWPYTVGYGNAFMVDYAATLGGTTDGTVVLEVAINGVNVVPDMTQAAGVLGTRQHVIMTDANAMTALCYVTLRVTMASTNTLDVPISVTCKCII